MRLEPLRKTDPAGKHNLKIEESPETQRFRGLSFEGCPTNGDADENLPCWDREITTPGILGWRIMPGHRDNTAVLAVVINMNFLPFPPDRTARNGLQGVQP